MKHRAKPVRREASPRGPYGIDAPGQRNGRQSNGVARLESATVRAVKNGGLPANGHIVCIHEFFHQQAERTPQAVAIIDGDRSFTYGELLAQVDSLSHRLAQREIGPDVLVGVLAESCAESVIAILAILAAGGAYLPLDPHQPRRRMAESLRNARPRLVLGSRSLFDRLPVDGPPSMAIDALKHFQTSGRPVHIPAKPDSENLAYVIYTSGSAGEPKGVVVSHGNAAHSIQARLQYYGRPVERFLLASPLFFDSSVAGLFWTLATGGALVLPGRLRDAPHGLPTLIANHQITHLLCTPSLWRVMLQHSDQRYLASLDTVIVAGETCTSSLARDHLLQLPNTELYNEYGPTEASVWCTVHHVDQPPAGDSAPIGRPIEGAAIHLLDENMQPVADGSAGELYVGGAGVAQGYLDQEELTNRAFVDDPFSQRDGDRLYRTGDLARRLADGSLEFVGRIDRQVKIRGWRVELEEVERALADHPQVAECAVAARNGRHRSTRLVAYVAGNEAPTAEELRRFCSQRLPAYMTPAEIVVLDQLPRNSRGKIDLAGIDDTAVREDRANHANIAACPRLETSSPRSALELQLSRIFEELLARDGIGPSDDFLALGGDSLLVMELLANIEKRFGAELPMQQMFSAGLTVARLAAAIEEHANGACWSPIVPLQPHGSRPPFYCIHPGGGNALCYLDLARRFTADRPFYALQAPGVDGVCEPLQTVEEMASRYVQAIRTAQPAGPYYLGGWSFGGIVAYEMARQLRSDGQQVGRLVLVDSGAMYSFAVVRTLFPDKNTPIFHFDGIDPEVRFSYFNENARRVGLIPPTANDSLARRVLDIFAKNLQAVFAYRPEPFAGKATLIVGEQKFITVRLRRGLQQEWSELCQGGMDVLTSPGDHVTMIREPHAAVLAQRIEESLCERSVANKQV